MTSSTQGFRESVLQRGQSIRGWLGQLFVLYTIFLVLYAIVFVLFLLFGRQMDDIPGTPKIGGGLLVLTMLPGLVFTALYLWAIRSAQRAIGAVYALVKGEGQPPARTSDDLRRFLSWLTAGQWLSVVSGLLSIVMAVITVNMLPYPYQDQSSARMAFGLLPNVVGAFVSVGLNWLILGAVRSFFAAALARSQGNASAVTPSAERAASWLQFVYILLWIGAALGGIVLLLGIFAALFAASSTYDNASALAPLLLLLIPGLAFYGWMLSVMVRLIGHSRLFALEAATQLDQSQLQHLAAGTAPAPDPWAGTSPWNDRTP